MIPSGTCFCGNVALYYANRKHFCGDHRKEAEEAAKLRRNEVVPSEFQTERACAFLINPLEREFPFFAKDQTFRRHIDRPRYNM